MKKPFFLFLFLSIFLVSCQSKKEEKIIKESSGKINNLSIIVDDQLWNGEVGDSLRKKFAAPVDGLPQEEPLFSISQYSPKIFEGFMTNSRNILIVKRENKNEFQIIENEFAKPQNVVHISGRNIKEVLDLIEEHSPQIIKKLKGTEIVENQRRIKKSLLNVSKLNKKFNLSLNVPTAYKYIIEDNKFVWLRKELPTGNSSLLVYEVPINLIDNDSNVVSNIIKMRDSIGKMHIEGKLKDTYMITEASYSPYFFNIRMNGMPTYETKGTWELKNDFMAGPFINYAIKDEKRNRYLVIEGFGYNPSTAKRDMMHELEAIIKSAKIK